MRKLAAFGAAATFLLAGTAQAAQTVTVANYAHVSAGALQRVERAELRQASQLRAAWGTPEIRFASHGWGLELVSSPAALCGGDYGCHGFIGPQVFMIVTAGPGWTVRFSHEMLETLESPYGGRPEVCDPVEAVGYRLDGVLVSDFITPAWLRFRSRGPWDEARVVRGAGQAGAEQRTRTGRNGDGSTSGSG